MTEDEAKGKWCPFGNIQGFGNRDSDGGAFHKGGAYPTCIGSACMAWRWSKEPDGRTERAIDASTGGFVERRIEIPGEGFCGLASQP